VTQRYSPGRGRRVTPYEQAVERLAASRAGAWAFLHVFSRIDRRLVPLTHGGLSVAIGAPVGLLETRGRARAVCAGSRCSMSSTARA
jgi:hypothetical protein